MLANRGFPHSTRHGRNLTLSKYLAIGPKIGPQRRNKKSICNQDQSQNLLNLATWNLHHSTRRGGKPYLIYLIFVRGPNSRTGPIYVKTKISFTSVFDLGEFRELLRMASLKFHQSICHCLQHQAISLFVDQGLFGPTGAQKTHNSCSQGISRKLLKLSSWNLHRSIKNGQKWSRSKIVPSRFLKWFGPI